MAKLASIIHAVASQARGQGQGGRHSAPMFMFCLVPPDSTCLLGARKAKRRERRTWSPVRVRGPVNYYLPFKFDCNSIWNKTINYLGARLLHATRAATSQFAPRPRGKLELIF